MSRRKSVRQKNVRRKNVLVPLKIHLMCSKILILIQCFFLKHAVQKVGILPTYLPTYLATYLPTCCTHEMGAG